MNLPYISLYINTSIERRTHFWYITLLDFFSSFVKCMTCPCAKTSDLINGHLGNNNEKKQGMKCGRCPNEDQYHKSVLCSKRPSKQTFMCCCCYQKSTYVMKNHETKIGPFEPANCIIIQFSFDFFRHFFFARG